MKFGAAGARYFNLQNNKNFSDYANFFSFLIETTARLRLHPNSLPLLPQPCLRKKILPYRSLFVSLQRKILFGRIYY